MSAVLSFRSGVLAWDHAPDDLSRYRRTQATVLAIVALVLLLAQVLPPPEILREPTPAPLPAPMAKLILEKPVPLVLPAVKPKVEAPVAKAEVKPVEPVVPPKAPPKPQVASQHDGGKPIIAEARNPVPDKPPGEAIDAARRKATGVGLLAMKDTLAEMHGAPTAVQLNQNIKPGAGVGSGTGPGVGAGTEPGLPTRAMITANAGQGSGGINTGSLSRDSGGGGLAGRSTTLVAGVAGGGGGGGAGVGGKGGSGGGTGSGVGTGSGNGQGGTVQRGGGGKAARSLEDVRLVFERNKGAIYAIYNRALREDPSLQGKVVLELKIAPSGQVEGLRIVSTELKAPELEAKLLARIRQFDFGAKDVEPMSVNYPLDFLPS